MTVTGLEGIDFVEYRPAAEGEWFWAGGAGCACHQGPTVVPVLVIVPLPGFRFRYDIATDSNRIVSAEGVIPSAASMTFDTALQAMKGGAKVRRPEWPAGRWLEFNERLLPHLCEMPGVKVWAHSRADMVAGDWVVVA